MRKLLRFVNLRWIVLAATTLAYALDHERPAPGSVLVYLLGLACVLALCLLFVALAERFIPGTHTRAVAWVVCFVTVPCSPALMRALAASPMSAPIAVLTVVSMIAALDVFDAPSWRRGGVLIALVAAALLANRYAAHVDVGGFTWRLVPEHWAAYVSGAAGVYWWLAPGFAGMAAVLSIVRRRSLAKHLFVVGVVALHLVAHVAYPALACFTWCLPIVGLYAAVLVVSIRRWHAWLIGVATAFVLVVLPSL